MEIMREANSAYRRGLVHAADLDAEEGEARG